MASNMKLSFEPGEVVVTRGINELMGKGLNPHTFIKRHLDCDWSEMSSEDQKTNKWAVKHGSRVLSAYDSKFGKIWVITEWDRSVTTVLLPDEY